MAPTLTAFDAVRARIASAMLAQSRRREVGRFVLRDAQRRSLREIQMALRAHGGALVTDAVGSGKTVLALATAAAYDDALAIVPAALREQWLRAAHRARVGLRIATHESLSRGRAPQPARLVIVDEAHHFRNPSSRRYRALAALVSATPVLLLTATPVVNRRAERDALLALFLGRRATEPRVMDDVIITRMTTPSMTDIRRLPALPTASDLPSIATALRALPPPLPAADGAAALALVRVTLAFAWASSLAALDAALRRRVQRGELLADALQEGRWPTRDALRDWIVGHDCTQLALAFTVDTPARRMATAPSDALEILENHLHAVRRLRAVVTPQVAADVALRAAALRTLAAQEFPRRIVLLAHHAETVRALYAALRDRPGTVAITGSRVHAAAGRWTRDEVLQRLGPGAPVYRPDDIQDIQLLLATDILAEGVELQGCATLVHGDAAWTPARLTQRVGRIARDGQRLPVHVVEFALPRAVERLLALRERLGDKRRAQRDALRPANLRTVLHDALRDWLPRDGLALDQPDDGPRVAAAWAADAGFVALLQDNVRGEASRVIAGLLNNGRWRLGSGPALLSDCVRSAGTAAPIAPSALRQVRRLLRQWQRRERSRVALRDASVLDPALLRHVARQFDAWLGAQPIARRPSAIARLAEIRSRLQRLRGVAVERSLGAALRDASSPFESAEACMAVIERLTPAQTTAAGASTWRLSALLLLRPRSPGDPAPRAASPGIAATR